ncbi:MAG: prolipoprotein diacylglyceryl transferase [Actinomycetota bacterium]|nr:prolipoprotein diacylglyceryl transferase [Actinomycetota bacterium]
MSPVWASIPSPPASQVEIGPFPLRGYALAIILGVVVAVVVGDRRWQARGGRKGFVLDVATIAVPAGIVGARLYHVVTTPRPYFGPGGDPVDALKVWEGGLGIWGGVAGGALAAWLVVRREGLPFAPFADAVAPGVALAQAVGRFGNWFNQELYGRPTDLPWALEIDPEHRPAATPDQATYHPTFLYEALWNTGVAALVIWADRRFRLGGGRAAALYVAAYCSGRLWIEALRVDAAERVLGLRLNIWTSLIVGLAALALLVLRRGAPREAVAQAEEPRGEDTEQRAAEPS